MKRFASWLLTRSLIPLGLAIYLSVPASAQDRTISVREVDVTPRKAEVDVLPDGGCLLTAYANVAAPSVEPRFTRSQYVFNGPRCTTVKNAIITAAKKDLEVGDGSAP